MMISEARIDTERASRYLVQLCKHASQSDRSAGHRPGPHGAGHRQPGLQDVKWSDTDGTIVTDNGRCTVHATGNVLTLRAEAAGEDQLQQVQKLIGTRLETIGRRDGLAVHWQRL